MARRTVRAPAPDHASAPLVPTGALAVALLAREPSAAPLVHVGRDLRRLDRIAAILRALAPARTVAILPEWDCLPFDRASPSRGTMGARAGVLRWLADRDHRPDILLTTAPALIQRVPPPETWAGAHLEIRVGDALDLAALTETLRRLGYILDDRVDEPGEAAIRGRTLEVFPAAAPRPCRIEHDGSRVTAIRSYDPVSQRSVAEAAVLVIDPATEILLDPGSDETLRPFSGQEHGLARYYDRLVAVLDLVPEARLVVEDGAEARAAAFFEQIAEGRETARDIPGMPLYLDPREWADALAARRIASATEEAGAAVAIPAFAQEAKPGAAFTQALRERLRLGRRVLLTGLRDPLRRLVRQAEKAAERPVRPVCDWSAVRAARAGEILALDAPIEAGFDVPEADATVIAAADLLGHRAAGSGEVRTTILPMGEVDLRVGDVAIDRDHGLCVFEGLETVAAGAGAAGEALRLRFAGDAVLMVPVAQADRVWRYGPEPDAVALDRLDTNAWGKRRLLAEAGIARTARALVEAARVRAEAAADALVPPRAEMERFTAGFGFAPTADQEAAIDAVLADLASGRPMDRLVCGDVGFGKTEVALRAVAAAVFAGRQVAIVAPTTVLVRQHVETFRRRFARFGIAVAHLSRLVPAAEAKRVKAGLADGSVRIVVGTQALAGRGVRFADLGLTVIDEEQRFGAKAKAALRATDGGGHVLALTATPIPRTLQGALAGLQSLSVIATPPVIRQPIRTVIAPFDDDRVREALVREHRRGGQSFVVCPRIEDIAPMRARLAALAPRLEILMAHGALKPEAMDAVMVRFADGAGDVLLATNIVESGLDVPRANTMLVWEADRFGLAQLHQLRGRVGRGQRRGIAYLLSDPGRPPAPASEKRLRTLEALDRLGAGFAISACDLDQRGAGDLVGEVQAGHVERIGLGLYQHFLQFALRMAKGEAAEDWTPEIAIGLAGHVPADYVPEPELRLSLYVRLLRLQGPEEIDALRAEIEDRFGGLPDPVERLLALARLRVAARALGVARLIGGPAGLAAEFRPGRAPVTPVGDGLSRRGDRLILAAPDLDADALGRRAADFLASLRKPRVR